MLSKTQLIEALQRGDARTLEETDRIEPSIAADEEVMLAATRAAECVVGHRPNYRESLARANEIGLELDIWTAARAGLLDVVQRQISDDGQRLNAVNKQGRTALQQATLVYGICKECEEVADFLIGQGATIDVFSASTLGLLDMVQRAIETDPDVVQQRCQGSNALNWAVRPRRNLDAAPEICQCLLNAGADVHDRDNLEFGMKPLHHAAEWGPKICVEIVDLLLEAGADLDGQDDQGWSALDYALDRKRSEMAQHLKELGAASTQ